MMSSVEFTVYDRMIMNAVSNAVKTIESAIQSGVVTPEMVSMMLTTDAFKKIAKAHSDPATTREGEEYDVGQVLQNFLNRPNAGSDND